MLLRISLIVSLFSMSGTCHPATTADSMKADWSRTGILYGEDHAFALTAPDGWVLDNTAGISQDIHAVFYRVGGNGRALEVLSRPNTVLAKKLEEAFSAALYPLPPAPSWWVRVGITIAAD